MIYCRKLTQDILRGFNFTNRPFTDFYRGLRINFWKINHTKINSHKESYVNNNIHNNQKTDDITSFLVSFFLIV